MRALVYDIHGNLPALQAVLEDAHAAGAETFLLGGDYGLFGPWPAETVATLQELSGANWIRGNVDRWTARPDDAPHDALIRAAIDASREALSEEVVSQLEALPEQLVIDGTRYCHGSPISDVRSWMPAAADDDDELLGGVAERRVVFGHTHLQFSRRTDSGIDLVNPGSAGMPFDGDHRAAYALLADDGQIELRRIAYDYEASAGAMEERYPGEAWAQRSARRLRRAQMCD
jgi:diadenosine tetraphosphatase ApaH/serine/threonine PP2A family protein phosphatase